MSKHTPGPWVAVRWSDDEVEAYGWSFSAGGHLLPLSDLETDNPDECEANARLIASAPELLEALRMWQHLHEAAAGYEGKYGKELDAAIAAQQIKIDAAANASRAAIAKATGEKA